MRIRLTSIGLMKMVLVAGLLVLLGTFTTFAQTCVDGGACNLSSLNNIQFADQQPGTTAAAKINKAISNLSCMGCKGGIVDATGFGPVMQTIDQQINIGSATSQIVLIIDKNTPYQITINNSGIPAIQIGPGSALVARGPSQTGGNVTTANFFLAGGASVQSIVAFNSFRINGGNIYIEGITLAGTAGTTAAITDAVMDLSGLLQVSEIHQVTITGLAANQIGLNISKDGQANFTNLNIDGGGLGQPVVIKIPSGSFGGTTQFFGGSLTHPGTGAMGIVHLEGVTGNELVGVSFYGTQFESSNTTDTGIYIKNVTGVTIVNPTYTAVTGGIGNVCVQIAGAGTDGITVVGLNNFNAWSNNISNSINGLTYPNSGGTRVPWYSFSKAGASNDGFWDDATGSIASVGSSGMVVRNLHVVGNLSKGSGSFQIDDPLDPANKYLQHSFVESPDMMNVYNGVATLDANGRAEIKLPNYFEALNQDFRYTLTCIGRYAPVYVFQEVQGNRFQIAGGKAGLRVSWQVTGIRHDPYANAHRIQVEVPKPASEQGHYLFPDVEQSVHAEKRQP